MARTQTPSRVRHLHVVDVASAVERATDRIAPSWPLDRSIAVNPLWGFLDRPVQAAAAHVAALSGARLTMPRAWYRARWEAGRMGPRHVRSAIDAAGSTLSVDTVIASLGMDEPPLPRRALVTHVMDETRDLTREMPWRSFVVHAISQHCAGWFGPGGRQTPATGLYPAWRAQAASDLAPALRMGLADFRPLAQQLPEQPEALVRWALAALDVPPAHWEGYLTALLMDVLGWASWAAFRRFEARQHDSDDDTLVHLLAVRLAWEWILWKAGRPIVRNRWEVRKRAWSTCDEAAQAAREVDWILQTALELAEHESLGRDLATELRQPAPEPPRVQAAFCIDVRSEVLRRALEAQSDDVRTLGFAGFFGLPIAYQAVGASEPRPQLPGLLAPRLHATDEGGSPEVEGRRHSRLDLHAAWRAFRSTPLSGFTFVETVGLWFGAELAGLSLGLHRPTPDPDRQGLTSAEHAARRPRLTKRADGAPLETADRAELAAGILRAMSLTHGFARLVALVGHASASANNPHAAGLDCGACCGQSGEVNARAVAALLNDPEVRERLRATEGIDLPDTTWFVPGVHRTMTDDVVLRDVDEVPSTHADDLTALRGWLAGASALAREERAPSLGLQGIAGPALHRRLTARTRDWAQPRPEWGLAGNAAFVAAPRERTTSLDLAGRAFLHDYRWTEDEGFAVLAQILTAPVVVAHWINFQYYASTVDNRRFGSGNKVLHNVVGGNVGVFEGNGGDLRPGLALQSLHDGTRWVHEPLRLGVFVEAPTAALEGVLQDHEIVRHLVEHGWIHLYQLDSDDQVTRAYRGGQWTPLPPV